MHTPKTTGRAFKTCLVGGYHVTVLGISAYTLLHRPGFVMLLILSPSKTIQESSQSPVVPISQPELLDQSAVLVAQLAKLTAQKLQVLMGTSEKLTQLNYQRYQAWQAPFPESAPPAILAFQGDVYTGLNAEQMTASQLKYAQDHLRILSGLYGVLRPLDAMLPYRLEMGTKMKTSQGASLYEFWGEHLTDSINAQLTATKSKRLVNLASNEYFKSLKVKRLVADVVTPVFKDASNGKYRMVSVFAKKARGTMAAWMIRKKIKSAQKLIAFAEDGYYYDEASSTESKPVFLRD